MNRLEFKNVMKVLEIYNIVSSTTGRCGTSEEVHNWNGFEIFFYGSDYTIVNGKIPIEVAQTIYDKYPDNPYLIRIAGGCVDNKPIDWATNEELEKFKSGAFEILSLGKGLSELKNIIHVKKHNILASNPESLYINSYHIDTKEGLVILITELQDYYLRKILNKPNENIQVAKQSVYLEEINRRLIEQANLYTNTDQWIKYHNATVLEETKNHHSDDEQENKIRSLLNKFDETVNPFINDNIEMLNPSEYEDKISFTCYANEYNENNANYKIIDKKTGFQVEHNRDDKYITYGLYYGKKPTVNIHHYYCNKKDGILRSEEVICISHYGDKVNDEDKIDLRYNLTNGLAYETYANENDKRPITPEQKALIINELEKAIKMAESITINNMSTKKNITGCIKNLKQ